MPKTRQWGYIFNANDNGEVIENKPSQNLVVAHELGHGIFSLAHPFQNDDSTGSGTNWLMDYGNGKELPYAHWAAMSDESLKLGLFQDQEDGEHNRVTGFFRTLGFGMNDDDTFTFVTPSKQLLVLPNNVSDVINYFGYYGTSLENDIEKFNEFMNVVPGTLLQFTIDGTTFTAKIVGGEDNYILKGYFDDKGNIYNPIDDYGITINQDNSKHGIVFGVNKYEELDYHIHYLRNIDYEIFTENSNVVSVLDFGTLEGANVLHKSTEYSANLTQASITKETVDWVFNNSGYSNTDDTFFIRNKILELKALYPRAVEESTVNYGKWSNINLCTSPSYIIKGFENELLKEFCISNTTQSQSTSNPGMTQSNTTYSENENAVKPSSSFEWQQKYYEYLKYYINNISNEIAYNISRYNNTEIDNIETDNIKDINEAINYSCK